MRFLTLFFLFVFTAFGSSVLGADECFVSKQTKPHPDAPDGIKQLAFMIGEWDVTCRYLQADGKTFLEGKVHYHASYILDGYAVQDYWRQLDPSTPEGKLLFGSAIRTYEPWSGKWVLHWFDDSGFFGSRLEGEFKDGELRYNSPRKKDQHGEYDEVVVFYEIKADSFRWRMDRQYIGGPKLTVTYQEYKRIKP